MGCCRPVGGPRPGGSGQSRCGEAGFATAYGDSTCRTVGGKRLRAMPGLSPVPTGSAVLPARAVQRRRPVGQHPSQAEWRALRRLRAVAARAFRRGGGVLLVSVTAPDRASRRPPEIRQRMGVVSRRDLEPALRRWHRFRRTFGPVCPSRMPTRTAHGAGLVTASSSSFGRVRGGGGIQPSPAPAIRGSIVPPGKGSHSLGSTRHSPARRSAHRA